jgi:hypothetical protein
MLEATFVGGLALLKSGLSHKKAHKAQMHWPLFLCFLCFFVALLKMSTTFEAKPGGLKHGIGARFT